MPGAVYATSLEFDLNIHWHTQLMLFAIISELITLNLTASWELAE